jgi:tRNA(Ile)-lysidine synthase
VDFQRNRVRHELLPLLRRDYQPALAKTILRLIDIAGAEADFAMQAAKDWLQSTSRKSHSEPSTNSSQQQRAAAIKDGEPFEHLPVAVQRRCLQAQLLDAGVVPEFELIEHLRTAPSRPVNLARAKDVPAAISRAATRDSNGLVHINQVGEGANLAFEPGSRQLRLAREQGQASFDGLKIQWKIVRGTTVAPLTSAPGREVFDADKVGSAVILRHWRPGDRFQPAGMDRGVKLQDLFVNQKVPRGRRRKLGVATTVSGELIWVEGLRISERFKLAAATIRRLQWRWQRD